MSDYFFISQFLQFLSDTFNFVIPYAGVGGGVEAKESVNFAQVVTSSTFFLAAMGGIFGLCLALAAKKFAVKIDPRVEQVKDVLAHAHCGACGYAGCEQYAEAVVKNPDVPANLCIPAGTSGAEAVARITGKVAVKMQPQLSRIMCKGSFSKSSRRFKYEGLKDCRAAVLAGGGDKSCIYGCLGYGTCANVCPFDAITMSADGLPVVDEAKCTGCKKCEAACPKKVIEVLPSAKAVIVACHSKDKGVDTKKYCAVGCIGCGICQKVCPFDAVSISGNLSRIDVSKCKVCGLCASKCPTKCISDLLPQRPQASITDRCIGCQMCKKACPVNAISGEAKKKHAVDTSKCIGCGICTAKCPVQAIEGTFNAQEVFALAQAKKSAKAA